MKKTITFLVAVAFAFQLSGQETLKLKFGKVPTEDLTMQSYQPDTAAEAVILYDEGKSEVNYELAKDAFIMTFERFVRIKILKQSGTDWANFTIPLYSSGQTKEDLVLVDGVSTNLENGKPVKSEMKKDAVFQERENKYWEVARLSLPAVKVGTVIDLRYRISSPLLWNLQTWKFQYSIPVKWSQYEVVYPEYFKYNHSLLGYIQLANNNHTTRSQSINYTTTNTSTSGSYFTNGGARQVENHSIKYETECFTYTAKEVPSIKEEPYLTTIENYTGRLKFELSYVDFSRIGGSYKSYTTTWQAIADQLLADEDFGGQIKAANYLDETTNKLISGKTGEKEKALAVYDWVQHNINWNNLKSYMPDKPLRKVFSDKKGNSAEVNLILLDMLLNSGIKADPVLLSTREHGILSPAHPTLSDCNYIIVRAKIDSTFMLFDATEPLLTAGTLPFRCINGTGIVVNKTHQDQFEIQNPQSNYKTIMNVALKDGKLNASVNARMKGLQAFRFRNDVKSAGGPDSYFEKLKQKSSDLEYLNYTLQNLDSLNNSVVKKYDIVLHDEAENDPDIIYVYPLLFERMKSSPFTSPTRNYPIDFGDTFSETYMVNFAIPEGYKVEELPESKAAILNDKSAVFSYKIGQNGNQVTVYTTFTLGKSLFLPTEYKNLKEFYDLMAAKQSEQIVLKKISN